MSAGIGRLIRRHQCHSYTEEVSVYRLSACNYLQYFKPADLMEDLWRVFGVEGSKTKRRLNRGISDV